MMIFAPSLIQTPLPAEPPIGGPFWSIVVPALLFAGAFLATYRLYRRFADQSEETNS